MSDWTQLTARQLVDEIVIAISDKRPGDVKDITDVLAMREADLEELKREAAGLRAWNEKLRAELAVSNAAFARAQDMAHKANEALGHKSDELARLRAELAAAESIIARGVELMPLEQLSQWEGVREWQEMA